MTQRTDAMVPAYFYHRDAEQLTAWLAALSGLPAPAAAAKERLDAAVANNTDPIRLMVTPDEAAALVAALRAGLAPQDRDSATGCTVLRVLTEVQQPFANRRWRQNPPPEYF